MKKLLSLLSVTTIAGSGMTGIIGNALAPAKNEVNYQQTNNLEILNRITVDNKDKIYFSKKIYEIPENSSGAVVNNNNDIYFGTSNGGSYVLKSENNKIIKINGILEDEISRISLFNNNLYIGTNRGAYVLNNEETTAAKINGINSFIHQISIDNYGNVYFKTDKEVYFLSNSDKNATKINGLPFASIWSIIIDKNNNVYFDIDNNGVFCLQNKQLTAYKIIGIDSTKHTNLPFQVIIDNNNIYIKISSVLYTLNKNKATKKKISKDESSTEEIHSIFIDKNNNLYISIINNGVFVLKQGETDFIK